MHLAEILDADRIDASFSAVDKPAALDGMAALLAKGIVRVGQPVSKDEVRRVLEARESLLSTGVGSGVAIPHGRIAGLDRFVGALAIQRSGVEFAAIDDEPVSILFSFVGPDGAAGEHLKCLARISRFLRGEEVRRRLFEATSPEAVLAIVRVADA